METGIRTMTKAMKWLLIEEKAIVKEFEERYPDAELREKMLELDTAYVCINKLKGVYGY